MTKSCETCQAFYKVEGARGRCRMNPPVNSSDRWPEVWADDWCMKHVPDERAIHRGLDEIARAEG